MNNIKKNKVTLWDNGYELTDEDCCRWLALIQCLHLINKSSKKLNLDFNSILKTINVAYIKEFINEQSQIIEEDIKTGNLQNKDNFVTNFIYGD